MKQSLSQSVFELLKKEIVFNRLHPGDRLGETELCEQYSLSRTPVRQALQRLEALGLVDVRDGVGTFVTVISEESVRDAYEIRCMAEKLAAVRAIEVIPASELDSLEQLFLQIQAQLEKGGYGGLSFEEMILADWRLHDLIMANSGNSLLEKSVESVTLLLRRCQFVNISQYERATRDHLEIISCLKSHDYLALCSVLDRHLKYRPMS